MTLIGEDFLKCSFTSTLSTNPSEAALCLASICKETALLSEKSQQEE